MERATPKSIKKNQKKASQSQNLVLDSPAWVRFVKSIRSEFTASYYVLDMKRFMAAVNVKTPDELLLMERKVLEGRIINYIIARQDVDEIRGQSMGKELSGLRHFFTHNDRTDINWTIIRGYLKEPIKAVKDRAYTTADIQKMLEHADLRTRVAILLMASSGMRVGAVPSLKVKHLTPLDDKKQGHQMYAITVYEKTPDEYQTYCTPECRKAIDAYLDYRKRAGEQVGPNSPLIREQFDIEDKFRVLNPKHVTRETISSLTKLVSYKTGLRTKSKDRYERKETMLNHGFRKFFFKACGKAKIDPVVREYLMGHKIGDVRLGVTRLMMVYDATEDNEALKEYLRVIDDLTIDPANRLQKQVKELEGKAKAAEKVESLEKIVADSSIKNDAMLKRLAEQEARNNELAETVAMLVEAQKEREELERHRKELEKNG